MNAKKLARIARDVAEQAKSEAEDLMLEEGDQTLLAIRINAKVEIFTAFQYFAEMLEVED